jgi:hypothetical protein
VAFGIEMDEDKDEEGRALSLEKNGVRGKDDDDDDDVTENEMNSASPKTEGYLISQSAPKTKVHHPHGHTSLSFFFLFFIRTRHSLYGYAIFPGFIIFLILFIMYSPLAK